MIGKLGHAQITHGVYTPRPNQANMIEPLLKPNVRNVVLLRFCGHLELGR